MASQNRSAPTQSPYFFMFMQHTVCVIILIAMMHGASFAGDVFLQLEEAQSGENAVDGEQAQVVRSLEANIVLGSPFYLRTVADRRQWLLRGTVTKRQDGGLQVEYAFAATELREDPAPRVELEGNLATQFSQANSLTHAETKAETEYTLALYPFNPRLGFRGRSSGFSVRLVDETGQSVPNAEAALYGPLGNFKWERTVGPVGSDAEGIVRFSEGRESLPEYTFVAKHSGRSLVIVKHLDRSSVSKYLSKYPQSIKMRRELNRWQWPAQENSVEQNSLEP